MFMMNPKLECFSIFKIHLYIGQDIDTKQPFLYNISRPTFSVFIAFFELNFDLRCLRDIKVLTQIAMGAGALAAYCSGKRSHYMYLSLNYMFCLIFYFPIA